MLNEGSNFGAVSLIPLIICEIKTVAFSLLAITTFILFRSIALSLSLSLPSLAPYLLLSSLTLQKVTYSSPSLFEEVTLTIPLYNPIVIKIETNRGCTRRRTLRNWLQFYAIKHRPFHLPVRLFRQTNGFSGCPPG